MEKPNPPITGAGMASFQNILNLFLIKVPVINNSAPSAANVIKSSSIVNMVFHSFFKTFPESALSFLYIQSIVYN